MTPRELKFSILKSAFEGKLTFPMDSDSSSIDLRRRLSEKKKDYLNFLTEEKPFDIPEKWEWVIFGMCGDLKSGFAFKASDYTPKGIQVVRISDLNEDSVAKDNVVFYPENSELKKYEIRKNSFLICLTGSIGKMAWVQDDTKRYLNQRVGMFIPNEICSTKYLWYFLHTQYVYNKWVSSKTSTNGNIKNSDVLNLLMPLPPIEEQKRIVDRIEELLPIVDRYEEAWNKLEIFNKKFPIDLEKSIIQLAMKGKLTKQLPDEGNGGLLLKEIENKKKILLKEKKIDKDKKTTPINYDDLPFGIPQNWAWAKLQTVLDKLVDGDHNPPAGTSFVTDYWMLSSTNIGNNKIENLDKKRYLIKEVFEIENERTRARKGDIFFTSVGTLGRSCIFDGNGNYVFQRSVSVMHTLINNKYLKYYFDSPYFQSMVVRKATGTAQKGFYLNQLADSLVPIPPLKEQERIVEKLEELLPLCRKLVK